MDEVKENRKVVGVRGEDAQDMVTCRQMTRCGDPYGERLKGKEDFHSTLQ